MRFDENVEIPTNVTRIKYKFLDLPNTNSHTLAHIHSQHRPQNTSIALTCWVRVEFFFIIIIMKLRMCERDNQMDGIVHTLTLNTHADTHTFSQTADTVSHPHWIGERWKHSSAFTHTHTFTHSYNPIDRDVQTHWNGYQLNSAWTKLTFYWFVSLSRCCEQR